MCVCVCVCAYIRKCLFNKASIQLQMINWDRLDTFGSESTVCHFISTVDAHNYANYNSRFGYIATTISRATRLEYFSKAVGMGLQTSPFSDVRDCLFP